MQILPKAFITMQALYNRTFMNLKYSIIDSNLEDLTDIGSESHLETILCSTKYSYKCNGKYENFLAIHTFAVADLPKLTFAVTGACRCQCLLCWLCS